ncbi:KAP family P-loop NTPase fold protein [Cupriavidus metallidurans]|uniref:KAP P-loop containing nucleoside triphosphate hydrolase n=1 Tax=Cupriavidus metallidurans (strain ATCC 43123 / DSM 2839 / NBRC 102507 / CH34) TaxID=266264 RepID=Q1LLD3_CUPMC|nr:P-loop NTPase fold protein [Cupriavidus metallidurans]ABF09043.1 KAP P-loop containing nucleoside triphosphate hydrolase [Cupriavidus metallidurans CH34]QGS30066.1 NTPase KAP [Cupriavidus metallidurans]
MWHDNETTVDYVNFKLVAKVCADLIRNSGGDPISIGVSGGWGTGKSSLVRMIEAELISARKSTASSRDNSEPYVVVTFNPWLYQGFEDARTALLQTVGDAVLKQAEGSQTLTDKAKAFVKRINLLRLAQLGGEVAATLVTGVPVGLLSKAFDLGIGAFQKGSASEVVDAMKGVPEATKGLIDDAKPRSLPKEIQGFRDDLEELLSELGVTLVVFVDDLDRCLPKTAIATLEAIRLLLFLKGSAFVVAADDVFIRGAVRVHFTGTGLADDVVTNYFDKLIQVPLRVPRLGPNETKAYAALLFLERAHREKSIDDTHFELAKKRVEERLRETWKGKRVDLSFLESLAPQADAELQSLMGLAERLSPLLLNARAVQSNPRLVKRFLNTVFLRQAMAKPQGIEVDLPVLAKWHLLERCEEGLANALAELVSADSDGKVAAIRQGEEAAKDADRALPEVFGEKPFAREWLHLQPSLADIDLRPVLHLSRDGTVRDFGHDALTSEGKVLQEALVATRTKSKQLADDIRAAGETQAILAMTRAWEARRASRDWSKSEEVLMLTEVCEVFPAAGPRAAAQLVEAPVTQISPGLVQRLVSAPWARELVNRWEADSQTSEAVKRAIRAARKT